MADISFDQLTPATAIAGTDIVPGIFGGTDKSASFERINDYIAAKYSEYLADDSEEKTIAKVTGSSFDIDALSVTNLRLGGNTRETKLEGDLWTEDSKLVFYDGSEARDVALSGTDVSVNRLVLNTDNAEISALGQIGYYSASGSDATLRNRIVGRNLEEGVVKLDYGNDDMRADLAAFNTDFLIGINNIPITELEPRQLNLVVDVPNERLIARYYPRLVGGTLLEQTLAVENTDATFTSVTAETGTFDSITADVGNFDVINTSGYLLGTAQGYAQRSTYGGIVLNNNTSNRFTFGSVDNADVKLGTHTAYADMYLTGTPLEFVLAPTTTGNGFIGRTTHRFREGNFVNVNAAVGGFSDVRTQDCEVLNSLVFNIPNSEPADGALEATGMGTLYTNTARTEFYVKQRIGGTYVSTLLNGGAADIGAYLSNASIAKTINNVSVTDFTASGNTGFGATAQALVTIGGGVFSGVTNAQLNFLSTSNTLAHRIATRHSATVAADNSIIFYVYNPADTAAVNRFAIGADKVVSVVDIIPDTNGTLDLGSIDFPWDAVVAVNEVIVPSDIRIKKDIKRGKDTLGSMKCESALDFITSISTLRYKMKKGKDNHLDILGFDAQELYSKRFPGANADLKGKRLSFDEYEALSESEKEKVAFGNRTGALVPLLVEAIKQLNEKLDKSHKLH